MTALRFLLRLPSFTRGEKLLWALSSAVVLAAGILMKSDPVTLTASLVGAAFLILNAKGHPLGQLLTVVFSLLYGVISWRQRYYGEMVTYLGMTAPMAVYALAEWLRHPAEEGNPEVEVNRLRHREIALMWILTAAVTGLFFFILRAFGTARLPLSTLSVTTSFLAVYLTARRSAFFPLAYAANDLVLIGLWTLASLEDPASLPAVLCFVVFFVNDFYGFLNWQRMKRRQEGMKKGAAREERRS